MKQIVILILTITELVMCWGCKKETTNHLSAAEVQARSAAWNSATPITDSQKILGAWKANSKDMPDGSKIVEWRREFKKDGTDIESITVGEWATGPVLFYFVRKSKLYSSILPKDNFKEEGEIRLKKQTLLLKSHDGIYVFNRTEE